MLTSCLSIQSNELSAGLNKQNLFIKMLFIRYSNKINFGCWNLWSIFAIQKKVKNSKILAFFFYWITIISSFPMSYIANDYKLIGWIEKNTSLINTFKKRHVHLMYTLKNCKLWGLPLKHIVHCPFPYFSQTLKTTKCQAI